MIDKVTITLSETAQRDAKYIQIISCDQTSVNVVLVVKELELVDIREGGSDAD